MILIFYLCLELHHQHLSQIKIEFFTAFELPLHFFIIIKETTSKKTLWQEGELLKLKWDF